MSILGWKSLRLLLLIVTGLAICAPVALADEGRPNSLTDSSWALQFEIGKNFTLKSFGGSTISLKKHTAANAAWRLSLDLDFKWKDEERISWDVNDEGTSSGWQDPNSTKIALTVTLTKIKYVNTTSDINLFFGFGPFVGFSIYDYGKSLVSADWTREQRIDKDSFHAGLSGRIGTEWFATRTISLMAEYCSRLQYTGERTKDVDIINNLDTPDMSWNEQTVQNTIAFIDSGVRFGLSAYF